MPHVPRTAWTAGAHSQRRCCPQVILALAGKYTKPQVLAAIDFLKDQGHLYTTIDDDHCMWCA